MNSEKMLKILKHILMNGSFSMKGEDALAFSKVYDWVDKTLPGLLENNAEKPKEKKKEKNGGD